MDFKARFDFFSATAQSRHFISIKENFFSLSLEKKYAMLLGKSRGRNKPRLENTCVETENFLKINHLF